MPKSENIVLACDFVLINYQYKLNFCEIKRPQTDNSVGTIGPEL